jgi:hypothetical protein
MLSLNGQIATLNQGKQVGGLYDWSTNVILNYTSKDGTKVYQPVKKISALSYWLLNKIKSNEFYVEFFSIQLDKLILMDSGYVVIDFPDLNTLDKHLYAPIEVKWLHG